MATAATSLLGLALPVTGELSGTWGDTVNISITALLDTAVAGTTTLSSDADVTLTTTTLAANQARQAIILWTAGGTATRTITVPAQSKSYIVINKTSSSQSIKIVGAGPTTGVTIVAGTAALVVWNGVDFVTASVTSTTGVLPVANGGTGLTSGTSGGVLAYTASGTLASSTALAASALVIGGGAGVAPSTTTTGTGVVTALGVNTGSAGAFVVNGGVLGTPSSGTLTNATGLPISTGVSGLGTGIATALAVNVGTAGSPVVNGGALGSPSTAGTMPAFTLGGTVAGGGNQINNVIIGTTTPLAGSFTTGTFSSTLDVTGEVQQGGAVTHLLSVSSLAYELRGNTTGAETVYGNSTGTGKMAVGYLQTNDKGYCIASAPALVLGANNVNSVEISSTGLAVTGTLSATGTLSGGTSGTAYSFSGSAPATSLTLDSSGNLGLGVTSTSPFSGANTLGKLVVQMNATGVNIALVNNSNDAYTYITNDGSYLSFQNSYYTSAGQKPMRWMTSGSQDMTLDASGNLLVGTTSAGGSKFRVSSTGLAGAFYVTAASTTATEAIQIVKYDNNSTTAQVFQKFYINDGAAACGQINANGANTAAFGSTSDSRLKENIVDLPSQLSNIMALRPVEFDYIESEGGGHQIGFVAQEMQTVYSDTVDKRKDGMLMVTGWSKTEARLVKAIQEQQALITQLTARITALETP